MRRYTTEDLDLPEGAGLYWSNTFDSYFVTYHDGRRRFTQALPTDDDSKDFPPPTEAEFKYFVLGVIYTMSERAKSAMGREAER